MEEFLKEVIKTLRRLPGVLDVKVLEEEQKESIRKIEEEYSQSIIRGLGRPLNLGVFECLKRSVTVALLTDSSFKWPSGPYALIKVGDQVVAAIDEKGLQVRQVRGFKACEEKSVVFPPLRFPALEKVSFVSDVVMGSPSPPTDKFLKEKVFKKKIEKPDVGTALIGFNLLKRA